MTRTVLLLLFAVLVPAFAFASPTRIISVPSTDTQPSLSLRGDAESYIRVSGKRKATIGPIASNEHRDPGITIIGATLGLPELWMLKSEMGIDYVAAGSASAEQDPATLHAKLVLPELAFWGWSPALALGIKNYWPEEGQRNENTIYGLVSKTLPGGVRVSLGGYDSRERAVGPGGVATGVMASVDWLIKKRLWAGIDYTGGKNLNSGLSAGISYAFSKKAAFMAGYNFHTSREFSGTDTITVRASFTFL